MSGQTDKAGGTLPMWVFVAGVLLAGAVAMLASIQVLPSLVMAIITALTEGGMAAIVVIAAGGFAYPLVRRFASDDAPRGLVVITAALVGLWMLSTAVLLVGSLARGLLTAWVWWPIVGAGVILAAWQGRGTMEKWRPPRWLDGRALIWIVIALAAGLWLAGATLPPGLIATFGDSYDVLEYHLQLPREYYDNQQVSTLAHNIYSHFPLGVEMLYLLCMALRGGAYEGMYAAKMIHGAFGLLGVAAVFAALRRDEDTRARFSAALLATAPIAVYLSWLAMVDLAELCYLTAALLWLRQWMRSPRAGSAVVIGAMLGGACAVKYLSVGFVVAPIVAVMVVWPIAARRSALVGHAFLALVTAAVLFCPWLVRNAAATGNPVFPLASTMFERPDFWPEQCRQRWVDGHAREGKPPVPVPPAYEPPPQRLTTLDLLYHNFVLSQWFGPLAQLLAAAAVCVLFASTGKVEPWDWSLVAVAACQLGVWAGFTRGMPPRFALPVVVPMALLGGYVLARLAAVQTNPLRKGASRPGYGAWGMAPAVGLFMAVVGVNLLICHGIYAQSGGLGADRRPTPPPPVQGLPGAEIARQAEPMRTASELPEGARLMLVGESKAFYFPPSARYAVVFNAQPLDELARADLTGEEMLARLKEMGVTHLWFDWAEIIRLAGTYGFPSSLSAELVERFRDGRQPSLEIIRWLEAAGMTQVAEIEFPPPTTAPATAPASAPATAPASGPATAPASAPTTAPATAPTTAPSRWPLVTVYALPPAPSDAAATAPAAAAATYPAGQ